MLVFATIHGILSDNEIADNGINNVWGSRDGADNRKPQIRNCKGYAPIIKEEQAHGTFVVKIEAFDPDKQDRMEYSFITANNERPKFKIDPSSGMITTNHVFDRDEPAREKEVYVTVRVTDNGRPALDDVCTFKVTIEDINDNPPVFDKRYFLPRSIFFPFSCPFLSRAPLAAARTTRDYVQLNSFSSETISAAENGAREKNH